MNRFRSNVRTPERNSNFKRFHRCNRQNVLFALFLHFNHVKRGIQLGSCCYQVNFLSIEYAFMIVSWKRRGIQPISKIASKQHRCAHCINTNNFSNNSYPCATLPRKCPAGRCSDRITFSVSKGVWGCGGVVITLGYQLLTR